MSELDVVECIFALWIESLLYDVMLTGGSRGSTHVGKITLQTKRKQSRLLQIVMGYEKATGP
jgi:hypothetical protein